MKNRARTASAFALSAVLLAAGSVGATAHGDHDGGSESPTTVSPRFAAEVRRATAAFHNPDKAIAAGYIPEELCVPGMGEHWINPTYLADGVHDPRKPDVLLYESTSAGPRLVGVEWLQWDADGDLATDDDRPSLDGVPFDGPMLGHGPGMPIHYDAHLYVWRHNPDGAMAAVNPRVEC